MIPKEIPRIIIQTAQSRALPILEQASMHSIRCFNQDYKYMFFDNSDVEDFIDTNFPDYMDIFRSFRYKI
jgi:mannosyltransferase OCH1-like enzyme